MPVYNYECEDCGTFETVRRMSGERNEPAACPTCGTVAQRVTVGAPSFGRSGGTSSASGGDDAGSGSYGMTHRGGCMCCR
ncbi:hypothetical protein BRCH_02035 [Candidatus Burkholderia brachyanthoides]|nr:hypothetical protein BRCH_02035 [Candidatus Burkholderia brachyanthoides]